MLLFLFSDNADSSRINKKVKIPLDIADLLISAGQNKSTIKGELEFDSGKKCALSVSISRNGQTELSHSGEFALFCEYYGKILSSYISSPSLKSLLSVRTEPLVIPPLLHFNSYRWIPKSNPTMGMMVEGASTENDAPENSLENIQAITRLSTISSFKLEVVRALLGRASLFERSDPEEAERILDTLNAIVERYCGGYIENLRPSEQGMDIRITPRNKGESFSFDGLSSGQKEMIATLFLIWKHTHNQPRIVLIDEPELHLNTEWHNIFVMQLRKLAPQNQYIIATHSKEIFRSVDSSYRAVIVLSKH